ncbi:DASH complex subunit DAD3 [Lachancea thermotolerans]
MDELTPLQRSILSKYETLADSLHNLDETIKDLSKRDVPESPEEVLRQLREIEIKIALVGTLLKGSVYSLVLQRRGLKQGEAQKERL